MLGKHKLNNLIELIPKKRKLEWQEPQLQSIMKWLTSDEWIKLNKCKDTGKKIKKANYYSNYSIEPKIGTVYESVECFWCNKALITNDIRGWHGFLNCRQCNNRGCISHFSKNDDARICIKCCYKDNKIQKFRKWKKIRHGKWIDYYIKDRVSYGLYSNLIWYKGLLVSLLVMFVSTVNSTGITSVIEYEIKSCKIRINNIFSKSASKFNGIKVINYKKNELFDILKNKYDKKFKESINKHNVNMYLEMKDVEKTKFKQYQFNEGSYIWSKQIKVMDGAIDYGIKVVSDVIHPSVQGRALEWSKYIKYCTVRDGIYRYKVANVGTLKNHILAYDGYFDFSRANTVLLFNETNYDGTKRCKAYQKYQIGWYFQTNVCKSTKI